MVKDKIISKPDKLFEFSGEKLPRIIKKHVAANTEAGLATETSVAP